MVVADAGFNVPVENTLAQRFAAIEMLSPTFDASALGIVSWELAALTMSQMSVRVFVMPDAPNDLRDEMQKNLQYASISRLHGVKDSFFVIGPVDALVGDRSTITQHYPIGVDETEAWPPIGQIKLKQSTVVEPFVTKTTVIVGGRLPRRSAHGMAAA